MGHDGGKASSGVSKYPMFGKTAESLERADVKFGVVDCNAPLASGGSILEKFKSAWPDDFMGRDMKVFLSKNGNKPFAFPEYATRDYEMMLSFVSDEFMAKYDSPQMPKQLLKCLKSSSKPCGLLLTRGDLKFRPKTQDEFTKLLAQFRKVIFQHVNTKKIIFEAEFEGAPDEDAKQAFVLLKRLPDSHPSSAIDIKGKAIKIGARTYGGKFSQSAVAKFIAECEKDDSKMVALTDQPLLYPQGRKQDALDQVSAAKDKEANTEKVGETKQQKRKRERTRKMEKAKQEIARQKREGADTLEKSAEELAEEAALKAKGSKLASEKVKAKPKEEAKTGKKGSLQQDDEDEEIELDD